MQYATIIGCWKTTKLFCIHNHDTPIEMIIKVGPSSPFYACPKYDLEDLEDGERRCNNRLSTAEYMSALDHFYDMVVQAELNDEKLDLTNMTWKNRNGTTFKVLKHTSECLELGVINQRAIRS